MRARLIVLVFLGGTVGTFARAAIEQAFAPPLRDWPWPTLLINVGGAFLLGVLMEILARRTARDGSGAHARLLLGTGVLGGFTTYSTFAVETVHLPMTLGILYAVLTVVGGLAAAALGFRLARGRESEPVPDAGS